MGTSRQHKMVEEYLTQLEYVIGAQVLIEAKVLEVTLNQEFQSGINWQLMGGDSSIFSSNFLNDKEVGSSLISANLKSDAFSLMLRSLEKFGSLRVVSSPRITVLNNQTAVIKVAENEVYFKVNYQTSFLGWMSKNKSSNDNPSDNYQTISSSEIRTKPVGFIMPIQVSVNHDTGEVILFVRPTVSRKKGEAIDPAVRFTANKSKNEGKTDMLDSKIPIIEVREIDSVIRLKSGNIAILGGLMETRTEDERKGPAGSERMPILGHALGAQRGKDKLIELVILLKATIVGNRSTHDSSDLRLIRYYSNDPRPF